jgi:hypothetical protein
MHMGPVLVIVGAMLAVFVVVSLLVKEPRRLRGTTLDYGAMSEIESHDVEDMLEGINERRRRAGKRELGEELADELLRGAWDKD